MIRGVTAEQAARHRIARDEPFFHGHKNHYIQSPEGAPESPQAYLNEQSPGFSVQAHFHDVSQFQVIAAGSGRLGAQPVSPFTVHYAAAYVPYGPIVAGPRGLSYFTLRVTTNQGAFFMPESRDRLPRVRDNAHFTVHAPASPNSRRCGHSDVTRDALIDPQADGLAVWHIHLTGHSSADAPAHGRSGGRYYLVTAGTLLMAGQTLSALSLAWVPANEQTLPVAGEDGAAFLVLQFPDSARRAARPIRPSSFNKA